MAIDLLNHLKGYPINTQNTAGQVESSVIRVESLEAQKILQAIRSLTPGQTLQGEIVQAKGNEIHLLLQNTLELQAQLDNSVNITPGKMMTFEVKSNQNGQLSLRPLFANTGNEQNAMKALQAASLPLTDETLQMVDELMKNGMPINKETLGKIFNQMNLYPEADIKSIVLLNKMNIPVDASSLEQLKLYQTNNQELTTSFSQISNDIAGLVEVLQNQSPEKALEFIQGLKNILTTENPVQNETMLTENNQSLPKAETNTGVINPELPTPEMTEKNVVLHTNHSEEMSTQIKLQTEFENIEKLIKSGGLEKEGTRETIKNSLLELFKNDLLMEPEKLNQPEYVKEYYGKLLDRMDSLESLIKNYADEDAPVLKNTTQVKSNVEFMNQINELYHYVQLPLKMNKEQASGDLYVYKRKHAKTGDDGTLTALLHLSMPTLGNMDIFLSLKGDRLNTKFTMEKEKMLDFMESHMDMLNERLNKKGYNAEISFQATEQGQKQETVMEKILKEDKGIVLLSKQSFDARA